MRSHLNPCVTSHHSCPSDDPTWCISKSSTAIWVQKHGQCDDSIEIQCDATDICATIVGLFFSYNDNNVNLHSAHSCVKQKCERQWAACCSSNPGHQDCETFGQGEMRLSAIKKYKYFHVNSAHHNLQVTRLEHFSYILCLQVTSV